MVRVGPLGVGSLWEITISVSTQRGEELKKIRREGRELHLKNYDGAEKIHPLTGQKAKLSLMIHRQIRNQKKRVEETEKYKLRDWLKKSKVVTAKCRQTKQASTTPPEDVKAAVEKSIKKGEGREH